MNRSAIYPGDAEAMHRANKDDLAKIGVAKYKDTVGRPSIKSLSEIDNDKPTEPKHNTQSAIAKAANTSTGMAHGASTGQQG